MKKRVRLALGLTLVALTIAAFGYYVSSHPELLHELRHIPPVTFLWLIILYGFWLGALAGIMQVSLYICRRSVPFEENVLLNCYSALTNFFVPGQGGIALRGVYLKKKYKLRIRDYVSSMLLYYAAYALVSTCMLLMPSRPWWQSVAGLIVVGAAVWVGVRWYMRRLGSAKDGLNIHAKSLTFLLAATMLQAIVQVAIFAVELHSVNPAIKLGQVISYTGAANFSLFVALTPGAIGIREAFLVFSQGLHHISTANIVAASVIDRAVFLVYLGILFLITLSLHAKQRLQVGKYSEKTEKIQPSSATNIKG